MNFRNSDEVFRYFESFTNLERSMSFTEREYRLDRMRYLLDMFENPQNDLKIIHVAGSKGKGSTASAAAAVLAGLGYKTGLYTSPHLISYKERITHAGLFIGDSFLVEAGNRIRNRITDGAIPFPDPPTTFELLTLYAFLLFRETGCQWAVIETGIGGRLDATNVAVPEASVITPIELEHSDILGDTIEKIASEKCGIIKKGIPVFVSPQKTSALEIIRKTSEEKSAPLYLLNDIIKISDVSVTRKGTDFVISENGEKYSASVNLPGIFQAYNASLAVLTVKEALGISWARGLKYIENIPLKGRIEILKRDNKPDIVIDSSHTPDSAAMLADTLFNIYKENGVLIYGSVDGKDYNGMIRKLSPCFNDIIISKPGSFKKSSPEDVYIKLKKTFPGKNIILETDAEKALSAAENISAGKQYIAVTGSFYMASEIIKLLSGVTGFGKSF